MSLAWDRMRVYENHITVHKIVQKCIKSYKSVQGCSNSNLHSWLKKWLKKVLQERRFELSLGSYGNALGRSI